MNAEQRIALHIGQLTLRCEAQADQIAGLSQQLEAYKAEKAELEKLKKAAADPADHLNLVR